MIAGQGLIFFSFFLLINATPQQLAAILRSQTTMMQQHVEAMKSRMIEGFIARLGTAGPPAGDPEIPSLNERRFRDVENFHGAEGTWSEWSLKVLAKIKECDVAL